MIPRYPFPAVAWVTPSARDAFAARWGIEIVETDTLPAGTATLVACGGGKLIDRAKAVAKRRPEPLVLVAVPSMWGSGAEASPVVVLDRPDGTKDITTDPAQVPDDVVLWPELTASVPADRRRWGAADVWAHALEAIASPLGDVVLRAELARIIHELESLDPVDGDALRWLELSGRSCAAQARAGVGLAHGIAHVMEAQLADWGHARIVAAVLPAVLRRTAAESPRWRDAAAAHDLDAAAIATSLEALTTPEDTLVVLDALPAHWLGVLRDPCTRMSGYLIRRGELDALRRGEGAGGRRVSAVATRAPALLDLPPFGPRDEARLLAELERLTRAHLEGCPEFAAMWPDWRPDGTIAGLPYVHTQVFKHLRLRTTGEGITHGRDITSSATSGGAPSSIALDEASSALQARSTTAILEAFVGEEARPLVVLDAARSLRSRALTARIAAALALRPLSTDLHVVLADAEDPASVRWDAVERAIAGEEALLVYGFTWMLWLAWGAATLPPEVAAALRGVRVDFVHSGGWKKLEALAVGRDAFDAALLRTCAPGSRVLDYYGVAEQVGVVFPLCEHGRRHAPAWAEVVVRDPWTLAPLGPEEPGMLQLLNVLALGAPYHSVLTEDVGRLHAGDCPCGREGRTFSLDGRVPEAEVRGAPMSDVAHSFASTTVLLPFPLDDLVAGWVGVRRAMLRDVPEPFSRDEWAHLAASLDPVALRAPFETSFGDAALARARGHVAVWLPNNVSLLGPLTSILLSLTGAPATFKVGTRGDDLMTPWLEFVRAHAPDGPLRRWALEDAELLAADHNDPRVAELAAGASARIVFGSDVAIEAIERLPHPAGSLGFGFGDRRSEAWIEPAAMSDATVGDLVRVFAIFGQAGCTSPRRAVLLGGSPADALALRDALVDAWPRVQPGRSAMHVASANVAARQRAAVAGWDAVLAPGNAATVAAGPARLPIVESPMGLFVCAATHEEAVATAPGNLQTIGHVVADPADAAWIGMVARARAKRFVPLRAMHHFGPVWDGHAFWRALFEDVELVA